MTNPYIPLGPPGDTTNRTPKMLSGFRSLPVVNGDPVPTPSGTVGLVADLTIAAGDSSTTLTNQPSSESNTWFQRNLWFDARPFQRIRLVIDDVLVVGAAASRLIVKFATSKANALAGTFIHAGVGGTEVSASMAALGPSKSTLFAVINSSALSDVLWRVFAIGGDGALDPVVSGVHIQFLQGAVLDPCGGSGCPMPVGIYNGEDFSSYADEADFISFVEAESKNFYSTWYGDDGSVEGCSYAPGVTFCNNPVIRGRWKAVSSGSNIWDIIGFGCYTRFANPLLDTGGTGGGQLVRFRSVWTTIRFRIESGWTADDGYGFLVSDLHDDGNGINGNGTVLIRSGRVVFSTRADSSVALVETDVGPASMIVGTSGFVEVTIHGTVTDQGGGLWQVKYELFIDPACSNGTPGSGDIRTATPQATYTATVVPIPIGGGVNNLGFYDWDKFNFTTDTAQWPEKYIDVAQAFYSGSLT